MKKILVVGYLDYEKRKGLIEQNPDTLYFFESAISGLFSPQAIIEMVSIVDEVVFADASKSDRLQFEVACIMLKKNLSDYEEKENGEPV